MSCDNLSIPKPQTGNCNTNLFGIPYGTAGRTVAGITYPISGIVLHCYGGTIAELCNEMKCRTKSSVISGSYENSFHYGIGAPSGSGPVLQFTEDNDISWSFGTYKNNSYVNVPPPNIAINWPTLQAEHGINTTPDVYTIDIALAIGHIVDATIPGCFDCPTASGLEQSQHDMLVQLLAYLVQEYDITIDIDHIQFHDHIHCGEGQECACTDIETLLGEIAAFCPPCPQEAFTAPEVDHTDEVLYIYGATEPCCPTSVGCLVKIPWMSSGCFVGDLAVDGTLDSYILGLAQDPATEQWCLTRGCLAVTGPLVGCGTVDDPLRLDLCAWGAFVPDEAATELTMVDGIDASGCLIQVPVVDLIELHETPITVIDTLTVDLTVSGTNDHTLTAEVKISEEPANQIEVRPDGLFVDFTCIDFVDAYPEDEIAVFIGQNAAEDCVHQGAVDVIANGICAIAEDVIAEPEWLLGKTDVECPVFVTPASIVAAGLGVADTATIDLTLNNNIISGVAILDPAGDNILQDTNGLYVPDITVSDGFCVHMNYNSVTRNINSELIVSQLSDNVFECLPGTPPNSGAYVPVGAGLQVTDTDCIDLTLVGGVLSGVITLAQTQGVIPNMAQCIQNEGLYVPQGAGLTVTDTDCIDLTITNGNLTAAIKTNPSGDNQVDCGVGGLYVPTGAGLIANDTHCVNHNLVAGVLSTTLNLAPAQDGVPNILTCILNEGLYVPESHLNVVDSTCINLDFAGGVLSAEVIRDPTGDNQLQCLPAGLYVPPAAGLNAVNTDCITLNLAGTDLTATPILASDQNGCPNAIECLDDGLYVPELQFVNTPCIDFTVIDCQISAVPVTSSDDCNGLECRVNGLYVNNEIAVTSSNFDGRPTTGAVLSGVWTTPANPETQPFLIPLDGGGTPIVEECKTIKNPSDCNPMLVTLSANSITWNFTNATGTDDAVVEAGFNYSLNSDGGSYALNDIITSQTYTGIGTPNNLRVSTGANSLLNPGIVIAPGETVEFCVQPVYRMMNGTFNGSYSIDSFTVIISGMTFIS